MLIGATKTHQLADNLKAADVTLTAKQIADLDAATVAGAGLSELVHRPVGRYATRGCAGRVRGKGLIGPAPKCMRSPLAVPTIRAYWLT